MNSFIAKAKAFITNHPTVTLSVASFVAGFIIAKVL